jgi:hypothetical protein
MDLDLGNLRATSLGVISALMDLIYFCNLQSTLRKHARIVPIRSIINWLRLGYITNYNCDNSPVTTEAVAHCHVFWLQLDNKICIRIIKKIMHTQLQLQVVGSSIRN